MRFVTALAILLMASPSFAQQAAPSQPGLLPPGKPAGVQQASNHDVFIYISLGMIALTAAGLALDFSHHASTAAAVTPTTQ
jgi:hypothetical protein